MELRKSEVRCSLGGSSYVQWQWRLARSSRGGRNALRQHPLSLQPSQLPVVELERKQEGKKEAPIPRPLPATHERYSLGICMGMESSHMVSISMVLSDPSGFMLMICPYGWKVSS